MLPPFRVLWYVHLATPRCPIGRHSVGIVDEEVGSPGPAIVIRINAQVDLDPMPRSEAVATPLIWPNRETKPLVEVHRHGEITHGEDRCYPLHHCSFADSGERK